MEKRIVHPALLPEAVLPPHLLAKDCDLGRKKNWFLRVKHIFNEQFFCIHAPPTITLRNSFHPAQTKVFSPEFSGCSYARCQQQSLPHLPRGNRQQHSSAPSAQDHSPPHINYIPVTAQGAGKPQREGSDQDLKADNFKRGMHEKENENEKHVP